MDGKFNKLISIYRLFEKIIVKNIVSLDAKIEKYPRKKIFAS